MREHDHEEPTARIDEQFVELVGNVTPSHAQMLARWLREHDVIALPRVESVPRDRRRIDAAVVVHVTDEVRARELIDTRFPDEGTVPDHEIEAELHALEHDPEAAAAWYEQVEQVRARRVRVGLVLLALVALAFLVVAIATRH